MAKLPMRCPFNERMCEECQLYRGRHYYLCTNERYRGFIRTNKKIDSGDKSKQVNMEMIKRLFEPWSVSDIKSESETKMRLKVINPEIGNEKISQLSDAENWDWDNREIMRTVNGSHISSFKKLKEVACYLEDKGIEEITIVEAPHFMVA